MAYGQIRGGSVKAAGLASNAVTNAKLDSNAVTSAKIQDGQVANDDLAGSIADSKLNQITTGDKVAGSAVQLSGTSALENSTGLRLKAAVAGDGVSLASQVLAIDTRNQNGLDFDGSARLRVKCDANGGLELDSNGLKLEAAVAGAGLAHSNGVLSVGVDDSSLEIDSDALRVKASGVTNAMLAGSIANAKLINSTIAGVALGGNAAAMAAAVDGEAMALTAVTDLDAAAAGNMTVFNSLLASAGNTLTIGAHASSVVTIAGNLNVNGTTTTVSTANLLVEDKLVTLNDGGAAASAGGAGIEFEEDGSVTGFFKVAADRAGFEFQAPGNANTLTIDAAASKTITVTGALSIEADSVINQDLSTDAEPTFAGIDLNGHLNCNTQATDINMKDNEAAAFRIKEAGNVYMAFNTADTGGEKIQVLKALDIDAVSDFGSNAMTNVNIDSGTVDGCNVTVGSGKALDVSGGTLTLAANQISGDKVEGGTIASITISALAGAMDCANQAMTNLNVDSGAIDGAIIGAASAAAGTFTAATCTSLVLNGDITTASHLDWDLVDNNASALSFDASGAAGLLQFVTTNNQEGIKLGGKMVHSFSALTAAGGDRSGAVAIPKNKTMVLVAGGDGAKGCKLPAPADVELGHMIYIINASSSSTVKLYADDDATKIDHAVATDASPFVIDAAASFAVVLIDDTADAEKWAIV